MSNPRDSSDKSSELGSGGSPPHRTFVETHPIPPSHTDSNIHDTSSGDNTTRRQSLTISYPAHCGGGGSSSARGGEKIASPPQKKRVGDASAGTSGTSKKRASIEGPFKCILCQRQFETDKGLCGHMRSHPERSWRGAYPPPVFSQDKVDKDMGEVIQRLLNKDVREGGSGSGGMEVAFTEQNARSEQPYDLNQPAIEEDFDEENGHSPPRRKDGKIFDLNKEPSDSK